MAAFASTLHCKYFVIVNDNPVTLGVTGSISLGPQGEGRPAFMTLPAHT